MPMEARLRWSRISNRRGGSAGCLVGAFRSPATTAAQQLPGPLSIVPLQGRLGGLAVIHGHIVGGPIVDCPEHAAEIERHLGVLAAQRNAYHWQRLANADRSETRPRSLVAPRNQDAVIAGG